MDVPKDGRVEEHIWDPNRERLPSFPPSKQTTSSNKRVKAMNLTGSYDHSSPSILSTRQETQNGLRSLACTITEPGALTKKGETSGKRKHSESNNRNCGGGSNGRSRGIESIVQDFSLEIFKKSQQQFTNGSAVFPGVYRNVSILLAADFCSPVLAQRIMNTVAQLQSPFYQLNCEYDYAILDLLAKLGCQSGAAFSKTTNCMDPIYVARSSDKLNRNDFFIRADALEEQLQSEPYHMIHRPYILIVPFIDDGQSNSIVVTSSDSHDHEKDGDNNGKDTRNNDGDHQRFNRPAVGQIGDGSSGGSTPSSYRANANTHADRFVHEADTATDSINSMNGEVLHHCYSLCTSAEGQALSSSPHIFGGSFRELNVSTQVSIDKSSAEEVRCADQSNHIGVEEEHPQVQSAVVCKDEIVPVSPRTDSSGFGILRSSSRNVALGRLSRDISCSTLHSIPEGKHEKDDESDSSSSGASSRQSSMKEENYEEDEMSNVHNMQLHIAESSVNLSLMEKLQTARHEVEKSNNNNKFELTNIVPTDDEIRKIFAHFGANDEKKGINKFIQGEDQFLQAVCHVLRNPTVMMSFNPPIPHIVHGFAHDHIAQQAVPVVAHVHHEEEEAEEQTDLLHKLYFKFDHSDLVSPRNIIALKKAVLSVEEDLLLGRRDDTADSPPQPSRATAAPTYRFDQPISVPVPVPVRQSVFEKTRSVRVVVAAPSAPEPNSFLASFENEIMSIDDQAAILAQGTAFSSATNASSSSIMSDETIFGDETHNTFAFVCSSKITDFKNQCMSSSKVDEIMAAKFLNQDQWRYQDKWINDGSLGVNSSMKNFCAPLEDHEGNDEEKEESLPLFARFLKQFVLGFLSNYAL